MIGYEEASDRVLKSVGRLDSECVPLSDAQGRILAEPLIVGFDLPRFDQSAVDGYAVSSGDLATASPSASVSLRVVGEVPAGKVITSLQLRAGETIRIFTGSKLPEGADAVVMQEEVSVSNGTATFRASVPVGFHIRRKGEEMREGARALAPGACVGPPELSLIATLGYSSVKCTRKPRVSILATGSELREPGGQLADGEIFASNGLALSAAVRRSGGEVIEIRTVPDDPPLIEAAVAEMSGSTDVLLTAGGISVGDHDYMRASFQKSAIEEVFWRVAIKPGKPLYFGLHPSGGLVFGLPGNPVSTLVTYELFVEPALRALSGRPLGKVIAARLTEDMATKESLTEFTRGGLFQEACECLVTPTKGQSSHMLTGMVSANCLIELPSGRSNFQRGDIVRVHLFGGGIDN